MPTLQGLLGYTPPVTNQLELKKALYAARPEVMQAKAKKQAQGSKDFFNGLLDLNQFVPVTGDVQSGLLAANDVSQGNYGNAALNAIGLLPFVPGLAGTVASKGGKLANALKKTQYEIAHDVAQKNAVEILGLPPNNTAMDRAKAMGFDTPAYHTSDSDIFAFDNAKLGSGTAANTDSKWAQNLAKKGHWFSSHDLSLPADGRPGMFTKATYPVLIQQPTRSYPSLDAAERGRSLPKVSRVVDEEFTGSTSYIVPEPSNIRSRFAAFDPARANEADLLGYIDPKLLPMLGLLGSAGMGAGYISQKGKE